MTECRRWLRVAMAGRVLSSPLSEDKTYIEESMAKKQYDLIVIGAGGAGSTAATTGASLGKRVALIERDKLGGTCLNYGCDPTKTLLNTANLLYHAQHASTLG